MTIGDLERSTWDREEVHKVFDGLEFRVLRDRLFETFEAAPDEAEGGFDLDASVLTSAEVGPWLDEHATTEPTGVHVVGAWGRGTGDVSAVALASAGALALSACVSPVIDCARWPQLHIPM